MSPNIFRVGDGIDMGIEHLVVYYIAFWVYMVIYFPAGNCLLAGDIFQGFQKFVIGQKGQSPLFVMFLLSALSIGVWGSKLMGYFLAFLGLAAGFSGTGSGSGLAFVGRPRVAFKSSSRISSGYLAS